MTNSKLISKVYFQVPAFTLDFLFIPFIYISPFVPVPSCLDYCDSVEWSEVREPDSTISVSFRSKDTEYFSICLAILIYFISILQFSEYTSFASLGRFIPRTFILFVATVNESVSLISLSDLSLLVYRNAGDLCILISYLATLSN